MLPSRMGGPEGDGKLEEYPSVDCSLTSGVPPPGVRIGGGASK